MASDWQELPQRDAVQALIALQRESERTTSWRKARYRRLVAGYRNRGLDAQRARDDSGVSWERDGDPDDIDAAPYRMVRNKFFEEVDTFVSKLAAEKRPQPALMVTDGDWETKRLATLATRLLEAEYDLPQGKYYSLYALTEAGVRLAYSATGSVAAKVYPWPGEKRVVVELHDTLDMFVDETEASYSAPQTYGIVSFEPRSRVAKAYSEHAKAIEDVAAEEPERRASLDRSPQAAVERVAVIEAWALPQGQDPGRHLVFLRADGTVLKDEPWHEHEPPLAFLHLSPDLVGFWALPPMDFVYDEILKMNEIISEMDFAHTHTDRQVHYVHEQSLVDIGEIEAVRGVKVVQTRTPGYQPHVVSPEPFSRLDLDLLHEHERGIARTLGIDEMHSGAKSEPGLPSAVAQREAASRFDDRAAAAHRAVQQWVAVDIARLVIKAQRKLYEQDSAFERHWRGPMFEAKIRARDILDLDVNALQVRVRPVGELKNTPEERVQYAKELAEAGQIPFESYLAVLENYDAPGETRVLRTQRRWVAWQIDQWLMTAPDLPVPYLSPRPWLRKSDALIQVVDELMDAEMSGVPQERLEFFLRFIGELTPMMASEATPPTAPQSPLGTPSATVPVPGAPGAV